VEDILLSFTESRGIFCSVLQRVGEYSAQFYRGWRNILSVLQRVKKHIAGERIFCSVL
jgi:hypothetical protein